jgi:energy-coupling factor transporter ATP-binding protein EcfA2
MMKLKSFRVRDFRSVKDSGWIDASDVTALIGTNESGKTNLLVPLWKLNPAEGGEINALQDYPRDRYHIIREMPEKPVFIEAAFDLPEEVAAEIEELSGVPVRTVLIQRDYDGDRRITFPDAELVRDLPAQEVLRLLADAEEAITNLTPLKSEETAGTKDSLLSALKAARETTEGAGEALTGAVLRRIKSALEEVDTEKGPKTSVLLPRYMQVSEGLAEMLSRVTQPSPDANAEVISLIEEHLPSFVYYSNYGNLDSEIYLPHVIQNQTRDNLGFREQAKARTLRVLFNFVKLKPKEIWELGRDFQSPQGQAPTAAEIKVIADRKKERDVLLQSASTELTERFRDWWKQGDYRFRFQADGDHFRIWVSDDKRPEDIELESRSTGLQWFLSFFLVFLVESRGAHQGAILLLDEPGASLHPIAQRDLSAFFENLSQTNQILYTTHSPFMVDPDHLDRVKAVYVDDAGDTAVSSDLRASERSLAAQSRSIYPVYAALGLSVSDTLLQGCKSVVVEGQSDQVYLSAVKNYLIGKGLITPSREILFIPSGGVKGIGAVTSIVSGGDGDLPFAVLDSDGSGKTLARKLESGIYQGQTDRLIMVGDILGMDNAEIEDLFPAELIAKVVGRYLPRPSGLDEDFDDAVQEGRPIVPQIEEFVAKHELGTLELGWKVEIAKEVKSRLLKGKAASLKSDTLDRWVAVFERLGS